MELANECLHSNLIRTLDDFIVCQDCGTELNTPLIYPQNNVSCDTFITTILGIHQTTYPLKSNSPKYARLGCLHFRFVDHAIRDEQKTLKLCQNINSIGQILNFPQHVIDTAYILVAKVQALSKNREFWRSFSDRRAIAYLILSANICGEFFIRKNVKQAIELWKLNKNSGYFCDEYDDFAMSKDVRKIAYALKVKLKQIPISKLMPIIALKFGFTINCIINALAIEKKLKARKIEVGSRANAISLALLVVANEFITKNISIKKYQPICEQLGESVELIKQYRKKILQLFNQN